MEPFVERSHISETIPLVVSIPHAGTHLPQAVLDRLASDAMRALPLTDWHVHELLDFLPHFGVTVLHATWSRFYSDLNRPPELGVVHEGIFSSGIIALETEHGEVVWAEPPTTDQVLEWRRHVYEPYHARLRELLREQLNQHGKVVLIDAHSVPSYEETELTTLEHDIYLGNRNGETCGEWLMNGVTASFAAQGFDVAHNGPFAGGYITEHYGRMPGVEALQVEIVQRVYMDENDPCDALESPRFATAKAKLANAFRRITAAVREGIAA